MRVHWIVFLIVIGAALFAPAVSAKVVEEKDGYIISTTDDKLLLPDMSLVSSSTITQGQTDLYNTYVPSGLYFLRTCIGGHPRIPCHLRSGPRIP